MLTLFLLGQMIAYWTTAKRRMAELVKMCTAADTKRQKAEDDRDALKKKLAAERQAWQEKEQELAAASQAELKRQSEAWQQERQQLVESATAREGRITGLKTALDVSEAQRREWRRGYQRVRTLCAESVSLYQKTTEFKELVAAYSLQSFYEGALSLKEFVDERAPGIDYSGAEALLPVPDVEIPEVDNEELLRSLNTVFEGGAEPESPQLEETPRTPQDGIAEESAPLPRPSPTPAAESSDPVE